VVSNSELTINATPNPILAGEGVLIYGQLNVPPVAGQKIVLYHHVTDSRQGYTQVGRTMTNQFGFYEFTRAENVVETNRSWFVRELGAPGVQSGTIYEQVAALVSLAASATTADTATPITFTGHVTPDHARGLVLVQEQNVSSGSWVTIKAGRLDGGSNYSIAYTWRTPGVHDVRVVFPGDARNVEGASDPVAVTIQQAQAPGFTINSSAPIINDGQAVTISGVLDQPGTATPAPNVFVQLWARHPGQGRFAVVGFTITGADGSYQFGRMPGHNVVYQARTAFAPFRETAVLFEAVGDAVALTSSSPTAPVGGTVTFSGLVAPDKGGHVVYLQRLGTDGDWHTVEISFARSNSTFQFVWRFGLAGTEQFRASVPGDENNVGGASPPVVITVSGLAPVSSLPTQS
jgi:hypothetical protein